MRLEAWSLVQTVDLAAAWRLPQAVATQQVLGCLLPRGRWAVSYMWPGRHAGL